MDFKRRRIQYLAAITVSLANLSLGALASWPSPVIPKLLGNETSIILNENDVAWIVSMISPGIVVGSLISRYISDQMGRRNTILFSAFPTVMGTLLLIFGYKACYLYISRFFWGVTIAILLTVIPMYIGEIADKEIRGTLTLFTRIMFNIGNLMVMSIGPFISYEQLNYMMLALPVFYFIACLWIPETPYYLFKAGKIKAARKAMKRLQGVDDKILQEKIISIQNHVNSDMSHDTSIKELLAGKKYRRALTIGVGLKVLQILSGTITLTQYFGKIMQESKAKFSLGSMLITFGVVKTVVSIMSALIVDKVNRRLAYMLSYFGSFILFLVISVYFYLQEVFKVDTNSFSYVPFVGMLAMLVISNLGYDVVTYITLAEVFPLNIKAVAMTTVIIADGIVGFGSVLIFQLIKQYVGVYGCFVFFGLVCLCAIVFVYIFVPETKGKSLKEIQVLLEGKYAEKDMDEVLVGLNYTIKDDDKTEGVNMDLIVKK